jgi:hypothetical protein
LGENKIKRTRIIAEKSQLARIDNIVFFDEEVMKLVSERQ